MENVTRLLVMLMHTALMVYILYAAGEWGSKVIDRLERIEMQLVISRADAGNCPHGGL